MTIEHALVALALAVVASHSFSGWLRPRQIESAVRAAMNPIDRELGSIRDRLDDHDERFLRTETGHKALESENSKRLTEVLMHVSAIEAGMLKRDEHQRLCDQLQAVGKEVSVAATKANLAVDRVTRMEQNMMEKGR